MTNLITVGEYNEYLLASKEEPPPAFQEQLKHPERPVILVGQEEARNYCTWRGGSLPTEDQWLDEFEACPPLTYWEWMRDDGVVRGGWWLSRDPDDLRTVVRHWYGPDNRLDYIGFRCAFPKAEKEAK